MSRRRALAALSGVTSEQWGMVAAAQARRVGVSRVDLNRLIGDGVLERVDDADRVYRLVGSPEDPELDGLRAAWLQLGGESSWEERVRGRPDAVVSHRSAAHARGLGDLIPVVYEFYVDRRHRPARSDLKLHVRSVMPVQWTTADGLPVCGVEEIVSDLLAAGEDESAIATICQDAVRDGLTNRDRLLAAIGRQAAAYGETPEVLTDRLLRETRSA